MSLKIMKVRRNGMIIVERASQPILEITIYKINNVNIKIYNI